MGLKLRKKEVSSAPATPPVSAGSRRSSSGGGDAGLILFLLCGLVALMFAITQDYKALLSRYATAGIQIPIGKDVVVVLKMKSNDEDKANRVVQLGPHHAHVFISHQHSCSTSTPRIRMRLKGDALVYIPLEPYQNDERHWTAVFHFPLEGKYELDARWYACHDETNKTHNKDSLTFQTPNQVISFEAIADNNNSSIESENNNNATGLIQSRSTEPIFPPGFWISKDRLIQKEQENDKPKSDHVWIASQSAKVDSSTANVSVEKFYPASSSVGESTVLREEATPISHFFGQLSNYELVCWVGSHSSVITREAFFSLRPQLYAGQRRFKFHHYSLHDFRRPDQEWDLSTMQGFRKCKHVLISVDELQDEDVSQAEYARQVNHFLHQVVKCLHDDTFPIWMFTVNRSPVIPSKMCHSRAKLTAFHPCNDAIFALFGENSTLPKQVKLLDNTDLVHAQFDNSEKDIAPVIAMRIFALVGFQVQKWREAKQKGIKPGLMRNGTLEPNPEQDVYKFE